MCKFYRYLSYRFYTFLQRRKDFAPAMGTAILFYFLHLFQYLGLTCIFPILCIPNWDRTGLYIFLAVVLSVHVLIWRKRRIEKYVEEFKDENPKRKKIRSFLIAAYFIGTYIIVGILFINS